jgi:hypothetical protein
MAGLGLKWKHDDRPQRHGWAPGEYVHSRCIGLLCRELEDSSFIGDKRAIICADCAYAMPDLAPTNRRNVMDVVQAFLNQVKERHDTFEVECKAGVDGSLWVRLR